MCWFIYFRMAGIIYILVPCDTYTNKGYGTLILEISGTLLDSQLYPDLLYLVFCKKHKYSDCGDQTDHILYTVSV